MIRIETFFIASLVLCLTVLESASAESPGRSTRIPSPETLRDLIAKDHPRVFYRPGDFEQLRQRLDEPPFRDVFQALWQAAEATVDKPMPGWEGFYAEASRSALIYRLTGDKRYLARAREALEVLAALDLSKTGYNKTHGYSGVVPNMAITLDYLWDDLDPAERDRFVAALVARIGQFHPGTVGLALRDADCHGRRPVRSVVGAQQRQSLPLLFAAIQ